MSEPQEVTLGRAPGMDLWPKVAIVILNWNGWRDTVECLESLRHSEYPCYQIILIDNASSDDSVHQIRTYAARVGIFLCEASLREPADTLSISFNLNNLRLPPRIILLRSQHNLGFCAGNNVGIRLALSLGADYVMILNNDTLVPPNTLTRLVHLLESAPSIGIVSPKIYYYDNPGVLWYIGGALVLYPGQIYLHRGQHDDGSYRGVRETIWCSGCAMLVRRQVFESIGFFDEAYFIWAEEADFSLRARRAGYQLLVNADVYLLHKEYRTLGRKSPGTIYYSTRNRMILAKRYLTRARFLVFLALFLLVRLIRTIQWGINRDTPSIRATWDAVYDFFAGNYGKWARHDEVYSSKKEAES